MFYGLSLAGLLRLSAAVQLEPGSCGLPQLGRRHTRLFSCSVFMDANVLPCVSSPIAALIRAGSDGRLLWGSRRFHFLTFPLQQQQSHERSTGAYISHHATLSRRRFWSPDQENPNLTGTLIGYCIKIK